MIQLRATSGDRLRVTRDILIVCYVILKTLSFSLLGVKVCELPVILTKEAVDDAKQTTHGTDDGRDDIILSLYLQAAGVNLRHACPGPPGAEPGGICHS